MISRKTAKLIADAYHDDYHYTTSYRVNYNTKYTDKVRIVQLHDFLYEHDYDAWFLNSLRKFPDSHTRELIDFIMKLHTGESVFSVTRDWNWDQREKLGQRYLRDLAQDLISGYERSDDEHHKDNQGKARVTKIKAQLELDGYIYKNGLLYQVDSSVIDEKQEQSYLETLVDQLSLSDKEVIKHHIKNAEEHYVAGKWDDSIANSRKFLEAILSQVAEALNLKKYSTNLSPAKLSRPVEIRDYLEKEQLIETKEKDATAKVYGLLSGTGSHPYIAEKDQARLMWHLALTFSQFVLLRYEGFLKANP